MAAAGPRGARWGRGPEAAGRGRGRAVRGETGAPGARVARTRGRCGGDGAAGAGSGNRALPAGGPSPHAASPTHIAATAAPIHHFFMTFSPIAVAASSLGRPEGGG